MGVIWDSSGPRSARAWKPSKKSLSFQFGSFFRTQVISRTVFVASCYSFTFTIPAKYNTRTTVTTKAPSQWGFCAGMATLVCTPPHATIGGRLDQA